MSTSAGCTQYESICDAYGGQGALPSGVLGYSETGIQIPSSKPAVHDGHDLYDTLPFTGFDVFLIVAGGCIALAAGLLGRRGTKAPAQSSD